MSRASVDEERARESDAASGIAQWPMLAPGDVHIWSAYLDDPDAVADETLLSTDERKRASLYRFERDRSRFIAGRARLRRILGGYLGRAPAELVFTAGRYGKPLLALSPAEQALHFNVTHAESLALYAVARSGEVGVDVEHLREIPDWELIADNFFAPEERAALAQLDPEGRGVGFLDIWTRREALLKAAGEGLVGETQGRASVRDRDYVVRDLAPAPGYVGALATAFKPQRVLSFAWSGVPRAAGAATVET